MNARSFMVILLWLITGPLCVQAADDITREKIESENQTRTYFIYVPSTLKQDTKVPLLILLHGSGRNGLSLVERWKDLAKAEGFIIVGPDSSNPASWRMPHDGPEFLFDLTEMLIEKYPIAADRVYVFGHSGGAVMALALAMFESQYYAAVAVHAGAWRSDGEFKAIDSATRKIPLMLIVGDGDALFPLRDVKKTQTALVERGFDAALLILKNHNHNYYGKAEEINRDAWQFLKTNALSGERIHVRVSFKSSARSSAWSPSRTNTLKRRANDLIDKFYAKEADLRKKDLVKERSEVSGIARAQLQSLDDALKALREILAAAENSNRQGGSVNELSSLPAPRTNLRAARDGDVPQKGGNSQDYFSLISQATNLRIQSIELLRARAELLLSDEDHSSLIAKRNELAQKSHAMNLSAEELEKQANQLRPK